VEVPAPEPVESEPTSGELASTRHDAERVTESGLVIEDLVVGTGSEVTPGARVRMHYVGRLRDGTVFDSSRERNTPMEVEVGKGYLIKGFEEGVMGMRVGGKRRLVIPPQLGYGERNVGGKIPANATLEFEVEVLEIL